MYHLVEKRGLWFTISLIGTIPGLIFVVWHMIAFGTPLPLNIDFTGGTQWEIRFNQPVVVTEARQVFVQAGYSDTTAFHVEDDNTIQFKLKNLETEQKESLAVALTAKYGEFEERFYRSIGPAIGAEVSLAAVQAVFVAALLILLYIAWAFRQVSHPFRYGTCAVIALFHDVMVTISFIAIMNLVAGWEIDALFLTAVLTVIGFSVNDTIVVFDRIRENLRRYRSESFATVANRSLIETMQRSVATQVTAMLILTAILVLGGATLQQFMATLLVGLFAGTYSSIFNATALLAAWDEGSLLPKKDNGAAISGGQAALA